MVDYLSDDKIAECKEVFDLYDKDNDGAIGIRELEELFRTLGSNATHDLLTKYLVKHEKEDLSCVSFNDFLSLNSKTLTSKKTSQAALKFLIVKTAELSP